MIDIKKSKLDKILDDFDKKQKLIEEINKQVKSQKNIFHTKFDQIRKKVIRPCLEEISEKLQARGHKTSILEQEAAFPSIGQSTDKNISLNIYPCSDIHQRGNTPYISFNANLIKKVISIYGSTMMPTKGGTKGPRGDYPIAHLTKEVVESEVLKLLEESFK